MYCFSCSICDIVYAVRLGQGPAHFSLSEIKEALLRVIILFPNDWRDARISYHSSARMACHAFEGDWGCSLSKPHPGYWAQDALLAGVLFRARMGWICPQFGSVMISYVHKPGFCRTKRCRRMSPKVARRPGTDVLSCILSRKADGHQQSAGAFLLPPDEPRHFSRSIHAD